MIAFRKILCAVLCGALLFPVYAQDPPPADTPPPPPADTSPPPPAAPAGLENIQQVQIQVWISETNEQGLRELGMNLNYTRFVRGTEQTGSVQQVTTNVFDPRDFSRVTLPAPDQTLFAAPLRPDEDSNLATGVQTREGSGLTASIIDSDKGTIDALFRGTERKSDVDLISKPEILVVNAGKATIKAGGQVPYQDVTYDKNGVPQLAVVWRDVGVTLEMTPTILPNNYVNLDIANLEVSDINRIENLRGVDLPVFSSRKQTGQVYVPDGQTLVIGGLSSRVIRKTERRVPLLGSLPVIGAGFRSRNSEADITTLLIFVSPTVVDLRNMSKRADSAINFWRQTTSDWSHSKDITHEVENMSNEY